MVDQVADFFRTTHKVKTQQVVKYRGQHCGDIELSGNTPSLNLEGPPFRKIPFFSKKVPPVPLSQSFVLKLRHTPYQHVFIDVKRRTVLLASLLSKRECHG